MCSDISCLCFSAMPRNTIPSLLINLSLWSYVSRHSVKNGGFINGPLCQHHLYDGDIHCHGYGSLNVCM